jgi:hypothetical protein
MSYHTDVNPHSYTTVHAAYMAGRDGEGAYWHPARSIRLAVASWTRAQHDHAETSYWGVVNVRKSRAYFIGLRRFWRSGEGSRIVAGLDRL